MTTPPHTCQAAATARLQAEPRYWTNNLPSGHGRYTLMYIYIFMVPGCAQIDTVGT